MKGEEAHEPILSRETAAGSYRLRRRRERDGQAAAFAVHVDALQDDAPHLAADDVPHLAAGLHLFLLVRKQNFSLYAPIDEIPLLIIRENCVGRVLLSSYDLVLQMPPFFLASGGHLSFWLH